MSITINTADYIKSKQIVVNGMEWEFIAPGAGRALELSRLARKLQESEADSVEQEKFLDTMFEYYGSIFKDSTEDNSEVTQWLRDTPFETINSIIQDIQKSE